MDIPHTEPSEVERIARLYRQAFDASDDAIGLKLAQEYHKAIDAVRAELTELTHLIADKKAAGEVITEQMLWKEQTYRRWIASLQKQMEVYSNRAIDIIDTGTRDRFLLGAKSAEDILTASFRSVGALNPYWERVDVKGVEAMYGFLDNKSPLYKLIKNSYGTQVDEITSAMLTSYMRGFTAGSMAQAMLDASSMTLNRALLIAQTETARAYRFGQVEQYRKSGSVEYFVRFVNKYTACAACIALDGEKFAIAEDLYDHPRGCCNVIAKVKGVPMLGWEKAQDWITKQPEDYQVKVFGKPRYDALKSGQLKLGDFLSIKQDPTWGASPGIKSLKELGLAKQVEIQ